MKTPSPAPAMLLIAAGTLSACAGLDAPQQEATNPAYEARIAQLAGHPCNSHVAGAVEGAGVGPDEITELFYTRELDGTNDRVVRYTAWMRLAGQPGHLVVDADALTCRAMQIYTRGGAEVAGVSSF
ncbi:hypothetical protein [Skermanella pratensis]|uniref:hypothetical protein n=1 Tax=Skermanella pratensis TaxID=2233999 RepID=UPI0013011D12|nr:hypothetical protein [Skermanella pratensis]